MVEVPFALATDPLPIVRRDTLYGVTTDEFDVPYVVVAGGVKGRWRDAVTEIEPATPGAGARSFTKKGGAAREVAGSFTRVVESDSVVNIDDRSSRRSRALACLFVQPLEGVRLATTLVVGCGESALG